MDSLRFLALYSQALGEGEDLFLFSRMSVAERFGLSLYHAAKLIKSLRDAGIIVRVGNQYRLNKEGHDIAFKLDCRKQELLSK